MRCTLFNGSLSVWIKTLIIVSFGLNATTTTGGNVIMMIILCPGGQHSLVCSTNHLFSEWSVRTTSQLSMLHERTISSSDRSPLILPIRVNTANITFSRDSPRMVLPLMSTMSIENVNNYLEGTMINCTGRNSSSVSNLMLMTTIHVIDINRDVPNHPVIAIRTRFEPDTFTITLDWSQFSGETYSVATVPDPVHKNYTPGSTNIQLVMRYNTLYNVTITATLCGHRNATNFTTIHHSKCDLPFLRAVVISVNTEGPLIGGSTISYSCSTGQIISGPNTSTCTDNGHWEPDPMDIMTLCIGPTQTSTITTSSKVVIITNYNQSNESDTSVLPEVNDSSLLEISVAVSIIVLVICLISILIITTVVIIALKRRGIQYFKKIENNQENSSKRQGSMTITVQELEDVHKMTSTEADQSCRATLVYADVFSSSTVRPKPHNVALTIIDDDRVNYAKVSHTLKSKISKSAVDSLLNLDNLLIEIKRDATQVWYQLGEALGIEKAILDKFITCSPEEAIIEMLDYWLRSHTGKSTWKEVADALRKIRLHESASRIEKIYEKGELSAAIDLDLNQVTERKSNLKAVDDLESPPPVPPKGTNIML